MSNFHEAVGQISEVMQFENWLRFYFISGEDDKLSIVIPELAMIKLRENYAHLAGLAERLNGNEITYQSSKDTLCAFIATSFDKINAREGGVERIFDSSIFQIEMQLFNVWVQSNEEQLDKTFFEFKQWQELFAEWKQTEKMQKYLAEMKEKLANTCKAQTTTVQ